AGEARDLDVLAGRWSESEISLPAEPLALVQDQLRRCRQAAQRPIERLYEKLVRKRFWPRVDEFIKSIRHGKRDCFGNLAQQALGEFVNDFLRTGSGPLKDAESLHAFRIEGKRVRYAMEIFAGAYDDRFRVELYPVVATLQDHLGALNDHV